MEIQLNATEDEEEAPVRPSVVSHAVPMSSLLSSDVSTPHSDAPMAESPPSAPRRDLSSLMNSPMEYRDSMEDAVDASQGSEAAVDTLEDDVDMDEPMKQAETLPELQDAELEALKTELQAALQRQYTDAPGPKRHKKGKQTRKGRSSGAAAAETQVQSCVAALQRKVSSQYSKKHVLEDAVSFSLAFCGLYDEKEAVRTYVVRSAEDKKVDVGATLDNLTAKPLYGQLVGVIRRAVLSCGEEKATELLTKVLNWCLAREEPSNWTWMLAVIAQMNSYFIQEFLFHEAVARYQVDKQEGGEQVVHFLPVLEFLTAKHPIQMVDILRDVLEECDASESGDISAGKGSSAMNTVARLVMVASDSALLVKACDDNLQWIITEDLITTLGEKLSSDDGRKETNGNVNANHSASIETLLLRFVDKRSAELVNSGFQLLLLLQKLLASELPARISASVNSFQTKILEFAATEPSQAFIKGVYRFLPYICQTTLRLLQVMTPVEKDETMEPQIGEKMSEEDAAHRFDEWKRWLCLLAQSISRKEVTDQLVKAELMLAEFNELPIAPMAPTATQPRDRALCELLTALLSPPSPDYVAFVRNIVQECHSAAPRGRRRILGLIQTLLDLNDTEDVAPVTSDFPITLSADHDASCLQQLASAKSLQENQEMFELWKGVRGLEFWESFLDLGCSKDPIVASRALDLVSRTPFLSLEDPSWQYRCVRKLSIVFFSILRQYRAELVQQRKKKDLSEFKSSKGEDLQLRLQSLKMNMFRVLVLDGGVARYASSVYSMFASLWLDALLSTTSATSIPTHFPNGVNFADLTPDAIDGREVIRCERTISSKCTNLQSSQVITRVPEAKLVYRKTMDSSWEREMHAARICSVYATDLFAQLFGSTSTAASLLADSRSPASISLPTDDDEQCERRLKIMVDMLLERLIPCCGIPSDDVYKDTLPNRSSFDVDLRVEQWLNHFPAFLPLLHVVINTSTVLGSSQTLRLVPVFKSALIVLLGHWNSVKGELSVENLDVPPYMRNQNQLALSCELMRLLRATNWLPAPLGKAAELLPLTTPADIRSILFSCWFYLSDHPPRPGSRAPTPATSATASPTSSGSSPAGFSISGLSTGGPTSNSSHPPVEFYLIPLRKALHRNIAKVGAKYPLFMC
ncbi:hypothetical protein PHYBOEH_007158 [Phytophthora boehmeriae]|uniref:Integrator complex subunit 5 C-terminal domain-containing protein n=1 Tax=Phytophthora boehmeriae TaxID=109152 RepID=A0A8T1WER4_9STRA|nr:hypothetical protein PHYBOEH_007158 [Phytophthora boehmeriae]